MSTERDRALDAAREAIRAVWGEGIAETTVTEAVTVAIGDLPEMETTALARDWNALASTTRREILRGIREHTRCDGDWRGRDDLEAAGKLAVRLLRALTTEPRS